MTTKDIELMRSLAVDGVGLHYALEPTIAEELSREQLRVVREPHTPVVPSLFLYSRVVRRFRPR